ncbi:MAG: ATP-binding protein [Candidatus Omnitrophica bacterium]|nr:ATP-binding protein [Candidatus Omnitrophota bacterium]
MTTTPIQKIWNQLKFVSDCSSLNEEQIKMILPILEEESQIKDVKRIQYLLKRSGIKRIKRFEDFDWKFNPKLPRNQIIGFSDAPWVNEIKNLALIGPSGVGKSHLAASICYRAIQEGIPTAFITCFDLVNKLKRSKNKHTMLQYYSTIKVLCLDELGYVFPSPDEANDIFQIISKRSELVPTIITSNLVPSQWGKIFEASTATAILDRLSLNGNFITCEGKSYRTRK